MMTYLPDQIVLPCGLVLKPAFAGSYTDMKKRAKAKGLRYRTVTVLSRNLRGKEDLHGKPYPSSKWLFTEVDKL